MKVKELKTILARFDNDDIVRVARPNNGSVYSSFCVDDATKGFDGIALWVESQNPMGEKIKKSFKLKSVYKN